MSTYRQIHRIVRNKRGKEVDRVVVRPNGNNLLTKSQYEWAVKRAQRKGHEIETRVFTKVEDRHFRAYRIVREGGERRAFRITPGGDEVFGKARLDWIEKRARKRGHEVIYTNAPDPAKQAPVIVGRGLWGALAPKARQTTRWGLKTTVRVHHTVSRITSERRTDEAAFMRAIQRGHMGQGYSDIGYNYVIFPSGRVYIARGKNVVGAHTLGHNTDIGIAFAGDFRYDKLTPRAKAAYYGLLRTLSNTGRQEPHKATFATTCPGPNLVKDLNL